MVSGGSLCHIDERKGRINVEFQSEIRKKEMEWEESKDVGNSEVHTD